MISTSLIEHQLLDVVVSGRVDHEVRVLGGQVLDRLTDELVEANDEHVFCRRTHPPDE